jgi:hypothetical protein
MRERTTKYDHIVAFIRRQPNGCTSGQVFDEYPTPGRNAIRKALDHLHTQGHLVRQRDGNVFRYFSVDNDPSIGRLAPVNHAKIRELEERAAILKKRGLFRRAAGVYAELIGLAPSVVNVETYARERARCISRGNSGVIVYSDVGSLAGRFVGEL